MNHAASLVALSFLLGACKARSHETPARADAAAASAPRKRARTGALDVTFVVASDTHVGFEYPEDRDKIPNDPVLHPTGLEVDSLRMIERLNRLEGHASPFGDVVARPRGLVVTGDLTEWGRKHEWAHWEKIYGLRGTEGPLKLPVFEMIGNHDTNDNGPWVGDRVAERHGTRHYSWDWDDLHLVALGEAPNAQGLAFLTEDLATIEANVPVVVFFHRALLGPWSTDNWFDDGLKERLHAALAGHLVVAIFHGHHHDSGHYLWNGIDVWKPGAVKDGAHTVAVVHVTSERLTLASYDWDHDSWVGRYTKPLDKSRARDE